MVGNNGPQRRIRTADKVFDIIEFIRANDGAKLIEISEQLDVANSTAHEYLATLVDRGYLIKDEKEYRLGLKFLDHGTHVRQTYSLSSFISPLLNKLAEKTNGLAELAILEDGQQVPLRFARGRQAVRTVERIGQSYPVHATAPGKAMLSKMETSRVEAILDRYGLAEKTEQTITERSELFEELATIRERGYAYNDAELVDDIRAVATHINAEEYNPMGLGVVGPREWMRGNRFREEIPQAILEIKNEVELKYKYES